MIYSETGILRMQKVLSAGRIVRGFRVDGPPPTWLLLPPLGIGALAWLPVLQQLRGKHAAIAIDFAGFGASDIGRSDPSFLEQQELLIAYLDKSLHGSLVLAACSTGAMFCTELARREEHRLEALFVSGFGLFNDADAWLTRVQQFSSTPEVLLQAMFCNSPDHKEELQERLAAVVRQPAYSSFFDANARAALSSAFEEISTPTLFVAGSDDALVRRDEVERAAGRVPSAQIHWVERCGHLAPTERPVDFVGAAQAFLESVRTREGLRA
jgi:pimeloyl-ACP methyl ester carboxylesterase